MKRTFSLDVNSERQAIQNKIIMDLIKNFHKANPHLSSEDFVIGGSSGASYLNCITLNGVKDIDIYIRKKDVDIDSLVKTERIDFIQSHKFCNDSYKERKVFKDGYYFLNPQDFVIHEALAALLQGFPKNFEYTKRMLDYLKIPIQDLIPFIEQELEIEHYDDFKHLVKERIPLLLMMFGDYFNDN